MEFHLLSVHFVFNHSPRIEQQPLLNVTDSSFALLVICAAPNKSMINIYLKCKNSAFWGVFTPSLSINRAEREVVPVGNNEWRIWRLGGSDEAFIITEMLIQHILVGKTTVGTSSVSERGESVHPLGENLIKQVSTSNCLGRGLWGNNFTTDEN